MNDEPLNDGSAGEAPVTVGSGAAAPTAGSLLRDARLAKGLHIAALATSIKVTPRKLELLEADRYSELPGATFTRALAQTVCRTLKIDPAPVLALLPLTDDHNLSQLSMGLNAPFRDKPGRHVPDDLQFLKSPVMLGAAFLVVASFALYLLPAGWVHEVTQRMATIPAPGTVEPSTPSASAPAEAAVMVDAASEPVQSSTIVVEQISAAASSAAVDAAASMPVALPAIAQNPTTPAPASAPVAVPAAASGVLLLSASAESWVEVIDGNGTALISRVLQAGESVGLDGASPLRVKIGNAAATKVSYKGRAVDLAAARDNVARFELR